jgi:hypothetical protein
MALLLLTSNHVLGESEMLLGDGDSAWLRETSRLRRLLCRQRDREPSAIARSKAVPVLKLGLPARATVRVRVEDRTGV